jgi:cell division protein FtsI (penicillin-binding protein 3)
MAPATNPRLVTVVVIDAPHGATHHGGDTAAPVFATVMGGALRLLGVPPDDADAMSEDPMSVSHTLVRR